MFRSLFQSGIQIYPALMVSPIHHCLAFRRRPMHCMQSGESFTVSVLQKVVDIAWFLKLYTRPILYVIDASRLIVRSTIFYSAWVADAVDWHADVGSVHILSSSSSSISLSSCLPVQLLYFELPIIASLFSRDRTDRVWYPDFSSRR